MVTAVEGKGRDVSFRRIIITIFILAMLVSIGSIGYLIFSSWFSSSKNTTENIARDINENIYNQICSFLYVPWHINEVNHKIIQNDILNLSDVISREKFFVGVLLAHEKEIYSFSYGSNEGEYYGARRNEKGIIEIMRNDESTGGHSWYFTVKDDLTAGELAVDAGLFDPRTREWYKVAAETHEPFFSKVYKHFVMDDLTVSAAWPIYNSEGALQGVLGTHVLLSDIGSYLQNTVSKYNGYAIIIEKDSGNLIANSMNEDNYTVLSDGTLERLGIANVNYSDLISAYEQYNETLESSFLYEGKEENLFMNIKEVKMNGLDWILITAFPEGIFIRPVIDSIRMTILLSTLALLLSFILYDLIIEKFLLPVKTLLKASDALSSGDFDARVDIVRNDEIGKISGSFNKVAERMKFLINNLEAAVMERTQELFRINEVLEENKNQLKLILDSTAEAIFGIDLKGNCTFCNISCIKLLGYESQDDLLGKNVHLIIHHSHPDGTPFSLDDCKIVQSIRNGKGYEAFDEVFWKADGTPLDVEYHAYPQIKNGDVVGGVVTFIDITERKKREEKINYLSRHDTLTGLYNRSCFEEQLKIMDNRDNLPISVIFADIDGLKLTNDIFGHKAGDKLIKRSAHILRQSCREYDIIARVGGDEFIILLPRTNEENTRKIISRIASGFENERISAIKCSISLGSDTKTFPDQSMEVTISNAENAMYKDKTINRQSVSKDIIGTLVETLHSKNPREKQHSEFVSEICGMVGKALNLPEPEISKLKRAGYLHDIGKIKLDESVLSNESLIDEEAELIQEHSVVGYRILNLFDDTLDLAELVYSHHERWDGAGYPRGLKGEQIPFLSRIITIVETYERILNRVDKPLDERKARALEVIKDEAGKRFDPDIVEVFLKLMA